jgi:hypothetical protein
MGQRPYRLVCSVPIIQVLNFSRLDGQWHFEICSRNRSSAAS